MRKKHLVLLLVLLLSLFRPQPAHAVTTHLRVGFNMHQAPYHFVDEEGNAAGMHIDMLEYVARQAGYELEYFPMETGSKCVESLNRGQIDLALVIKERYPNNPWVSDPISEEIICSLVKNGVESSSGQRIAVFQLGTLSPVIFSRLDTSYAFPVSDQEVALQYLIDEKASIMIGLKESILYYLPQEQTVSGMYTIESNQISMVNYALLVQKNDNALLLALNRHISAMRLTSEYSQIRQNWSYQEPENDRMEWLRYLVTILAIAVVIIGLYAIVDSSIRRALRIQVDKQTLALQQANQEILQNMEQLKSESDMRNRVIRYSYLGMVLFDHEYNVKLINDSALALARLHRSPSDIRELPVFRDIILACGEDGTLNGVPEEGARTITLENGNLESRYRYTIQHLLRPGQPPDILLAVENITDEEARRHAIFETEKNKILNQVVAGIAHEIKNPLMSIKTFVTLLADTKQEPAPGFMEDFSRYVPSEVERINRLVEGLISYAKPAKGIAGQVDLSTLVWETVFFARNSNQIRQISVTDDIEPGHCIIANRDQIKQVLINITMNGIESMREKLTSSPEKAPLTLAISLHGENASSVISIRDQGMGMTENAIARCVDPFFTTKKAGTGLGLTLSKQYVQDNNGQLDIISEAGHYTEIRITFRRESV